MSLFKILRGGYQNKPESLTDGWAYFTPDNKGFYIDVIGDVGGFDFNDRIQINEKVVKTTATLTASSWVSKTYSLSIDSHFSAQYYTLQIEPSLTGSVDENFEISAAMTKANISYMIDDTNSRIFFVANGTQPTINLPIIINFIPKEVNYIDFYIDSEGYIAIEGMTFEGWVNTPFNVGEWYFSDSGVIRRNTSHGYYEIIDCNPTDLIAPINYTISFEDDGCCFIAGTQVLMANGTSISIEDVKIGDQVISYNIDTGENYTVSVLNTVVNKNSIKMAKVIFDNGITLEMTDYHPLYTLGGWKSITNHMGYETLMVGDIAKTVDGWSGITNIEQYELETPIKTYTLDVIGLDEDPSRDDNTHDNFYANGIVAHNVACPI